MLKKGMTSIPSRVV